MKIYSYRCKKCGGNIVRADRPLLYKCIGCDQRISDVDLSDPDAVEKDVYEFEEVCPKCGAPISEPRNSFRCEFCDTQFFSDLPFKIPSKIIRFKTTTPQAI